MIAASGVTGEKYAVLGLGRSGLSAAQSLIAGGAKVVVWDDGEVARQKAEALGLCVTDLTRFSDWPAIAGLIVSPGIPHLYPAPHPVIAAALKANVPVDNDIGLFFRSFAASDWTAFDTPPKVIAVTGSNGKSTTSALIHHILQSAGRESQIDATQLESCNWRPGTSGHRLMRVGRQPTGGWRSRLVTLRRDALARIAG